MKVSAQVQEMEKILEEYESELKEHRDNIDSGEVGEEIAEQGFSKINALYKKRIKYKAEINNLFVA